MTQALEMDGQGFHAEPEYELHNCRHTLHYLQADEGLEAPRPLLLAQPQPFVALF
jgi:hypothetical protein